MAATLPIRLGTPARTSLEGTDDRRNYIGSIPVRRHTRLGTPPPIPPHTRRFVLYQSEHYRGSAVSFPVAEIQFELPDSESSPQELTDYDRQRRASNDVVVSRTGKDG